MIVFPDLGRVWPVLCCLSLLLLGCSRQDTECLGQLGRKLLERTQNASEEISGKLELGWKGGGKSEVGVQGRVEQRLRADKFLDGAQIEVQGNEKELQLRGTVKTPVQRQHAIQLAETTQGVERVSAETLRVVEP